METVARGEKREREKRESENVFVVSSPSSSPSSPLSLSLSRSSLQRLNLRGRAPRRPHNARPALPCPAAPALLRPRGRLPPHLRLSCCCVARRAFLSSLLLYVASSLSPRRPRSLTAPLSLPLSLDSYRRASAESREAFVLDGMRHATQISIAKEVSVAPGARPLAARQTTLPAALHANPSPAAFGCRPCLPGSLCQSPSALLPPLAAGLACPAPCVNRPLPCCRLWLPALLARLPVSTVLRLAAGRLLITRPVCPSPSPGFPLQALL